MGKRTVLSLLGLFVLLFVSVSFTPVALAAPTAHVLRIDPQTSVEDGSPVVTTVVDLTQARRVGEVVAPCASLTGSEQLECMSDALERPGSLATAHPFPNEGAQLTVRVGDTDIPTTFLDQRSFGESQGEARVGTAWLIVIDADSRSKDAFKDARQVAQRFVEAMGPGDLVDIVFLSDQQILSDSRWLDAAHRKSALSAIAKQESTTRSNGRTRPLLSLLKRSARDAFSSLGSAEIETPLHQAMVVIASGYGGGDPSTTGPGAAQLAEYLSRGRLDEDNTALPKLPVPVISIYMPPKGMPEHRQLAQQFMLNLANPDYGGFFTALQKGQGKEHAGRIVDTVRSRFSQMVIARFRLSCVAPTATQSFSLLFPGASPQIIGDSSFKDVPLGFDPRDWPLDIDVEMTAKGAQKGGGVHPGGTVRILGNFCWGSDASRPEAYFLPPGERLPTDLSSSPAQAQEVRKRLTSLDMRGRTSAAGDTFVEITIPDTEQVLHGDGQNAVVRMVLVDSKMRRTSGLSESTVLQLRGRKKPIPQWWYFAGGGAALVLLLLVALLFRTTRTRAAPATATPRPHVTESPYTSPGAVTRSPRPEASAGTRATIEGPAGRFTVLAGSDLRVGRDGTRCAAVVPNASVSGLHATFRFEQGHLMVRDESSASGTRVGAKVISPGQWVEVAEGEEVHLGPERLRVSLHRT